MTAAARLFIASSVEGLDVAYALQENLEYDCDPTVWSQGVFRPSAPVLNDLILESKRSDFAAFVFSPDDVLEMRGERFNSVRDNVVFEYGLFVGSLGIEKCFHILPRNSPQIHLPSDLLGITPLTYNSSRSDERLVAALGPASNHIRRALRATLPRVTNRAERDSVAFNPDFVSLWDAEPLRTSRYSLREGFLSHYDDGYSSQVVHAQRIFAFLESLSDAVLSKNVPEPELKARFQEAVLSFWPQAYVHLAPPNDAAVWWEPLPRLAELCARWSEDR